VFGQDRRRRPLAVVARSCAVALVGAGLLAPAASAAAAAPAAAPAAALPTTGTIHTFGASMTASSDPIGITAGPDGNVWYVDTGASLVGQVTPAGNITTTALSGPAATPVAITSDGTKLWIAEQANSLNQVASITTDRATQATYPTNVPTSTPTDIVQGSDGNLWFTEYGTGSTAAIGMVTRTASAGATANSYPATTLASTPVAITSDPVTGNLFFTEQNTVPDKIGEMSTAGHMVNEFPIAPAVGLDGIAAGPDGNLWYTEPTVGAIGRISPTGTGQVTFTAGIAGYPTAITSGPDGNLWFVDQGAGEIGRITVSGSVTEFPLPGGIVTATAFSSQVPSGITTGPDGNIWFTIQNTQAAIGKLTIAPALSLSASSLSFGTQAIGTSSASQVVTATSTSGGTAAIASAALSGANASDFRLSDSCTGANLTPSANHCQVGVSFAPGAGATGTRTATLTLTDNATPGGTQSVTLTGTASGGAAFFDQASLNFGNQGVGTKRAATTLTLTNATATAVTGADPSDFPIADHCAGLTLGAGQTCTIDLAFAPAAAGSRTATLATTDTAPGSPQTVALSGTGVPVGVSFTPASLNFGNQELGVTSTARTVTVTNVTSGSIAVTSIALTGPAPGDYAISADQCTGKTLAAGASCTLKVAFDPTSEGVRPASLAINDTAPGSPQLLALTGRGVHVVGYWLDASDGGIFTYGNGNHFFGSAGGITLNKPIVGMAATPDSQGYWEVATDGGIFSFGDAGFFGSAGSIHLNQPIVGMAPTPDGGGYYLVASDGGIFSYGDAVFRGSTGGMHLNKPIVGMAVTPDGGGYWLVASDGGIFSYGDAAFYGSTGSIKLNKPIVGMASTPDGLGYWLVATDGGIFSYGDASFYGSTGSIKMNKPIGMATTPAGHGYWLVATDGGIFSYGDAPFLGSAGSLNLNKPAVGMAPAL
jgi:streptogramin lyase